MKTDIAAAFWLYCGGVFLLAWAICGLLFAYEHYWEAKYTQKLIKEPPKP